ncbi:MAG: pyridoxal-phosphate dependent enzyme, partial [bacterium]
QELAAELKSSGKKPYIVPLAPVEQPKGALGYVRAAKELAEQFLLQKIEPDLIAVGSGSGLTHAGLLTGLRTMGLAIPVLGLCVRRPAEAQYSRILSACRKVERMLKVGEVVQESDVLVNDLAFAPGYGQVSEKVLETIQEVAGLEGILLDPVYTAKTVAGTLTLVESGGLPGKNCIVMIHTGGTPALFAYRKQILSSAGISL